MRFRDSRVSKNSKESISYHLRACELYGSGHRGHSCYLKHAGLAETKEITRFRNRDEIPKVTTFLSITLTVLYLKDLLFRSCEGTEIGADGGT